MGSYNSQLKVGQTIFVETKNQFTDDMSENLKRYIITKINTASIYARPESGVNEERFDKKTWRAQNTLLGESKVIWLSAENYREHIRTKNEKQELKHKIERQLPQASIEKIRKISSLLD